MFFTKRLGKFWPVADLGNSLW